MNKTLRDTIVKHVFASFALIPSDFVNLNTTKSLRSKEYLLADKIPFVLEDGSEEENCVWGCKLSVDSQEIKILLADCSLDKEILEYALLVHLKDNPFYGIYLVCSDQVDSESIIGCSMDGVAWMECTTYLQATFLAGMEQIKDIGFAWDKCSGHKDELNSLREFIQFHHSVYEG